MYVAFYTNIDTDNLVSGNILMQILLAEFQIAIIITVADLATCTTLMIIMIMKCFYTVIVDEFAYVHGIRIIYKNITYS